MNKYNEFSDIISETDSTIDQDFEPDDSTSTSGEKDQTLDISDPKPHAISKPMRNFTSKNTFS